MSRYEMDSSLGCYRNPEILYLGEAGNPLHCQKVIYSNSVKLLDILIITFSLICVANRFISFRKDIKTLNL